MTDLSINTIREQAEQLFALVRLGIGHSKTANLNSVDWLAVQALATQQGLTAIAIDGIERLPDDKRPPKELLLQWIGEVMQGYEYRYELYCRTIAELAGFYNSHGLRMMVLKGYACSLDWPRPEHRPAGDIDIWQFGKYKEGDALLVKEKGIRVDTSEHHHTVFYWRDFMVENHYDFINVYHHKSSRDLEKIFKELGADDSHPIDVYGEKVYLPNANLHALFLIKHLASHFASESVTLRQVLDWAFFVEKHGKEVDWDWLLGVLDEYQMREFFNCINAITVEELGFNSSIFPSVQYVPSIKEKVLNEILTPAFDGTLPKGLISRNVFRFRRWKANEWKHKLCYKESMWSAFWSGVWGRIIKPSTI